MCNNKCNDTRNARKEGIIMRIFRTGTRSERNELFVYCYESAGIDPTRSVLNMYFDDPRSDQVFSYIMQLVKLYLSINNCGIANDYVLRLLVMLMTIKVNQWENTPVWNTSPYCFIAFKKLLFNEKLFGKGVSDLWYLDNLIDSFVLKQWIPEEELDGDYVMHSPHVLNGENQLGANAHLAKKLPLTISDLKEHENMIKSYKYKAILYINPMTCQDMKEYLSFPEVVLGYSDDAHELEKAVINDAFTRGYTYKLQSDDDCEDCNQGAILFNIVEN